MVVILIHRVPILFLPSGTFTPLTEPYRLLSVGGSAKGQHGIKSPVGAKTCDNPRSGKFAYFRTGPPGVPEQIAEFRPISGTDLWGLLFVVRGEALKSEVCCCWAIIPRTTRIKSHL